MIALMPILVSMIAPAAPHPPGLLPGITVPVLHDTLPPLLDLPPLPSAPTAAPTSVAAEPAPVALPGFGPAALPDIEVSEIAHDQELDEQINADLALCERALKQLTSPGGLRQQHHDTWLVLFDFYRATGQQAQSTPWPPTTRAMRLQRSAPQWYSLPRLVADATAAPGARPWRW